MVGARGFEPRTSCAQGRRATRLRYAPTGSALLILKHFPIFCPFLLMVSWPRPCTYRAFILPNCLLDHDRAHSFRSLRSYFAGSAVELL